MHERLVRNGLRETRTDDVQVAVEVIGHEIDPDLLPRFSVQRPCLHVLPVRGDEVGRRKRATDLAADVQAPSLRAEQGEDRRSLRPYVGRRKEDEER
jgi:hypothetical protein